MGVRVGHGLQRYFPFGNIPFRSNSTGNATLFSSPSTHAGQYVAPVWSEATYWISGLAPHTQQGTRWAIPLR